jgi:hypothetical protein
MDIKEDFHNAIEDTRDSLNEDVSGQDSDNKG